MQVTRILCGITESSLKNTKNLSTHTNISVCVFFFLFLFLRSTKFCLLICIYIYERPARHYKTPAFKFTKVDQAVDGCCCRCVKKIDILKQKQKKVNNSNTKLFL